MKNTVAVEAVVGEKRVIIESGLLAKQARGAVTVTQGETIIFSAVTAADAPREDVDYFPLQVEYREKFYAAGRFPGGFFKRESRPSEKEVLTARFTDRPIRPLFAAGFRNEVQIYNMILSADAENEPDVLSITAASAALCLSDLPFYGPIAGVRVARRDGRLIINPTHSEREGSDLDLIYVCTREHTVMLEGDACEISEPDLFAAMQAAFKECMSLISAQEDLRRKLGLPEKIVKDQPEDEELLEAARKTAAAELDSAMELASRAERRARISEIEKKTLAAMAKQFPELPELRFGLAFDRLEIEAARRLALEKHRRLDGRGFEEIRPLSGQVSLLNRAHGSALFCRGETQALMSVTMGAKSDSQAMDAITGGPEEKKFMLHYNFPPYSVGEVGRISGPGRREIGHGALAERCLEAVMPKDYPYTVRLVSDIMGSNGSTSMASVCSGSMALMDAGVPIKKAVAGISIGLFTGAGKAELVTDILGEEDHCGDMDFKVAGTRNGITGFQVDLKIRGLQWDLIKGAFEKARDARLKILDFMDSVIAEPRPDLSKYAPRVHVMHINPEKIGELIGPGGKNIKRITELSGAQIDIEDDGSVHIFTSDGEGMRLAIQEVSAIAAEPKEGEIYDGTVTGIKEFGVFVEILPGKDGLVHISEMADFRVKKVEDICKLGDHMRVKCIGVDERGRVRLSRKAALADDSKAGKNK